MKREEKNIYVGQRPIHDAEKPVSGRFLDFSGERYYQIAHSDEMPLFFMSLVSSSDHWMFIASNGGLTAGRANAESALFPYETEDKIMANADDNGSKTIVHIEIDGRIHLWEPFSNRYAGIYQIDRHLYKNIYGNKLVFEEVNHDLQLTTRMVWSTGDRFGFIKSGWLQNDSDEARQISLIDGFVNLLPYGANSMLQNTMSNLLHAYKRSEIETETGMGIFALSATLTDRAEPSESLKATAAWQVGLDTDLYLLSLEQIEAFRRGRCLKPELDVRGRAGAYMAHATLMLPAKSEKTWHVVADVNQSKNDLAELVRFLKQDTSEVLAQLQADIDQGTDKLVEYVASADGLQLSAHENTAVHHFANVLFNIMRGGIFTNGYAVDRADLIDFVETRNRCVLSKQRVWFDGLPEQISIGDLNKRAGESGDADVMRLCYEYLPLTFSRRHGDPSRPWNRFSINLRKEDGSPNLNYQGNWRDIFQNWEPLALSFPEFAVGVIAKFLNATTPDGYNPYRVTREGIEWESPEPDNPWANIGYWSDHQIIYLQKLLEVAQQVEPDTLNQLWYQPIFAYAHVPYRLRAYSEMLEDWYNTIDFDWDHEEQSKTAVSQMGMDGRLLLDKEGQVVHVTMAEKMLVLLLAKLTNLVPEGGIWMNTQRPEWNDANNALVGKGLSVVTAGYLRRFIVFWREQLTSLDQSFVVNTAVADLLSSVSETFVQHQSHLDDGFSDQDRQQVMEALGMAATSYRSVIYQNGVPEAKTEIAVDTLADFLALAERYIDQTLRTNLRGDHLAHTYNILHLHENGARVDNLYLMLEGQVAMLSSGMLSVDEGLALMRNMRDSKLYRPDQHSYTLYPNRQLARFQDKNNVSADQVADSKLVAALVDADDMRLISRDINNVYHFNGRYRNSNDVAATLDELAQEDAYIDLVAAERGFMLDLFEDTFIHRAFTGRSGTFFAYEGLGSIYWHMVSKLLLAAQECYQQAESEAADPAKIKELADLYYDIRAGIGFNKAPDDYGAFPTDPYSHTPEVGGARQPGMTGQVKEEILTRWGELGLKIADGRLHFCPTLLRTDEFLANANDSDGLRFDFYDVAGEKQHLSLSSGSLAFTFCQVPIIYRQGAVWQTHINLRNGDSVTLDRNVLDPEVTQQILSRTGHVKQIEVTVVI